MDKNYADVDAFNDEYIKRAVWYTRMVVSSFRQLYMTDPKYAIVPEGFIATFDAWNKSHFAEIEHADGAYPKFMGMTVFESVKIENVYQIEVF